MPRTITFLALLAICASAACKVLAAEPTATDEREILGAGGEGLKISWRVSQTRLERVSQWKSGPEPPLSAGQAVTKARAYLRSHGQPSELPVTTVELEHLSETSPTCFIYYVRFGDAISRDVVVLLDGSVVTPVVTADGMKPTGSFPTAEALDFMKTAQAVFVFPVKSQTATPPDEGDLRLLGQEARQALLIVLTNPASWYQGLMTVGIMPLEPRSIGFLFRKGKDQLILFFNSENTVEATVEGTFRGKDILGLFVQCAQPDLDKWKQHYARRETDGK